MKDKIDRLDGILREAYKLAEEELQSSVVSEPENEPFLSCIELANTKHAFRGAAVTLIAYKILDHGQDIRAHKDEHEGGFSARTFDNRVTIPFLTEKDLPRSVETHWLTQTLSFSPKLVPGTSMKTQPAKVGVLLVKVVNFAEHSDVDTLRKMLQIFMIEFIKIRNQARVILTKPKNLPIDVVKEILKRHFHVGYKSNTPRLPQLAVYAIYMAIIDKMKRFEGQQLEELQRLKSADRKKGTVGDIVVLNAKHEPVEAIEIKYGQPITLGHVNEAIEKVRGASVSRYYMLSTDGVSEKDSGAIAAKQLAFLKQNGCEIIVNGVLETIGYYLRLVPSTTEFLSLYADLIETDDDTDYEHRIAWNEICSNI